MARYRTKPATIEADQWWPGTPNPAVVKRGDCSFGWWVMTRQGWVSANAGDFIITLADGETYPCAEEVFRSKYELADA